MEKIQEEAGLLVSVIVGALIGVLCQREIVTWRERLCHGVIGLGSGYYLTPIAMAYYQISPDLVGGVGFVVGVFGASIIAAVFKAIGNLDLAALVKNRIGGGGQ